MQLTSKKYIFEKYYKKQNVITFSEYVKKYIKKIRNISLSPMEVKEVEWQPVL